MGNPLLPTTPTMDLNYMDGAEGILPPFSILLYTHACYLPLTKNLLLAS